MKLHFEHKSTAFEFERQPMPERRFRWLCFLALAAIGGGVLVALVYMVGMWAIGWALAALALVGVYKLFQLV